ncbi:MAG TPA: 50S ribosomal protein L11 methyltransferase [Aestuariivirgaceae bacterium]|nr:50S ribosomal protein L11 methyltransferase [Aestuariivirgaceae bacterium]
MLDVPDYAAFIRANTSFLRPPLVPAIGLHLADEAVPLWHKTEEEMRCIGLPPPFWAFAWAGGQALARYVMDHPSIVNNRSVVDLASGSGIVAIAAAKAGASAVLASDIDSFAAAAIALNAAGNAVPVEVTTADLLASEPSLVDLILVGDLFYEQPLATRLLSWLKVASRRGTDILIGDPFRTYLPVDELDLLATYHVPVSRDLEDSEIRRTSVFRLRTGEIASGADS